MKLEGYTPGEGASVAAIVPCEDGSLWVLERVSGGMEDMTLDDLGSGLVAAGGDIGWASQVWRKLDASGAQELNRVDITELAEKLGVDAVTDTRMDREDRLYASSGASVTVLDAGLNVLFTCKGQETVERLVPLAGGVGAVTGDGSGRTVYPIDLESQSLGASRPLTGSADRIYDGNERYDFFYSSGDSLYGWSAENAAPEKLLSWSGAGVDKSQVEAMFLLPDGKGAAALRDGRAWPVSYSLARLAPAGAEDLAGRTVLTLATMGLSSETRARVLEFNRSSSQYRIEVRDYSEYNTSGDASAGLSKLNTEILAGNMPDLLDLSDEIPLRRYASRGLLEDLWPFIDSDPELGREGVMERPLEAAEVDGKLYQIFPRFAIETAAGAPWGTRWAGAWRSCRPPWRSCPPEAASWPPGRRGSPFLRPCSGTAWTSSWTGRRARPASTPRSSGQSWNFAPTSRPRPRLLRTGRTPTPGSPAANSCCCRCTSATCSPSSSTAPCSAAG